MATLILRFDAPLQSWGTSLKLTDHDTDSYPSKSGVIGMVASAMGIRRDDDAAVRQLTLSLRFGVRVDQPGELLRDYQVSRYGSKPKELKTGNRYYLADARFTCGLEASREELEKIKTALLYPANALYLGRRGCPPTIRLVDEIYDLSLEQVLTEGHENNECRILIDSRDPSDKAVRDDPVSFSPRKRQYRYRFMKEL